MQTVLRWFVSFVIFWALQILTNDVKMPNFTFSGG